MNEQNHSVNPQNHRSNIAADDAALLESRSQRFNLAIRHPAKWRFFLDLLLSSPMRLHRYRSLSTRIVEDAINELDCGGCK